MATNTYDALRTTTVGTSTSSVTLDLTGISGYTDLVLVSSVRINQSTSSDIYCQPNGVGTANKGFTFMIGNGSTATSSRGTNDANIRIGVATGTSQASGAFATSISHFMNYSNTTTFKTILSRGADATSSTQLIAGLFPSTNAITSIVIYGNAGVNILAGSTFSLYGIAAEGVTPAAKATGGIITSDSTYYYHTFLSTGVFTPTTSLSCEALLVAGGAGSVQRFGGGGGAGGVRLLTSQSVTATNYAVTVGAGAANAQGGPSSFNSLSATGGGYGGGTNEYSGLPGTGGSGGGGTGGSSPVIAGGAASPSGQGNAGGAGSYYRCGGGGGGGGAVGQAAFPATISSTGVAYGGNGGNGSTAYQDWSLAAGVGQLVSGTYYIAGGGGGGANLGNGGDPSGGWGGNGLGGYGGGGNGGAGNTGGASANLQTGTNGAINSGGGGGGMEQATPQTSGGSGFVIIRYLKA